MARYRSSRGRSGSGRGGALLAELIIWLVPKNPVSVAGAVVIGASIYFYYPPGIGAGFVLIIGGVFLFMIIPNPMCKKDKFKDNLHRGVFNCPQKGMNLMGTVVGDGSNLIKYKCKYCTAELKFNPATWDYYCEFCDEKFDRMEVLSGNPPSV